MPLDLYRFPFPSMGSRCEVRLYAASEEHARAGAQIAIADVQRLDAKYSSYRDDSVIAEINRVAGAGGAIEVDAETATLLDYAAACYRQSDGLFDVTSGVLRAAWDAECRAIPPRDVLDRLLERTGWEKLIWTFPRLTFPVAGMQVDFGGIVKEYAADRAAVVCSEAGFRHGLVDLGGDIRIIGPHPDGSPWAVGIRHPRVAGAVMGTLGLARGAIASSGDYERFVMIDGKRYGHILSPRTGMPVQGIAGVSVVAEECVVAGSAATIAILKEDGGPAWLEDLGLPHLWMDQELRIGGTFERSAAAVDQDNERRKRAAT
jgi:thiamine biosynthesis lipoprotein